MLAMYSDRPLKSNDTINNGKGFVISVTNKESYYLVKNDPTARLTEYSDYFLVFGKAELQFKIGDNILEFNIGHRFKSLNTGDYKSGAIFSGRDGEVENIRRY
jgi:hypothetical protein